MVKAEILTSIQKTLKTARQPMKRSELASACGISKSLIAQATEHLVSIGALVREDRTERGVTVFYYVLNGTNPWQVKRGRYVSVLCPCGRRVILSRVKLKGFEGWYSMICKGCFSMRYLHERELK
jgi:hypothetical protein